MIRTFITRLGMALKVLVGVRPAEVSFDEIDHRIAQWCAWEAANLIAGHFVPTTGSIAADDQNCCQICHVLFEAIKNYANHEARHGPVCREQLRQEWLHRERMESEERIEIPF